MSLRCLYWFATKALLDGELLYTCISRDVWFVSFCVRSSDAYNIDRDFRLCD